MNKSYQYLDIDVNKKIHRRLRAVQGDAKSRYILVSLYNNSMPFDLSNCSVKIFGVKSDKKIFFNYANIIDTSKGQFEIELTSQALAVNGELQIQILVLGANQERLTTCTFFIDVDRTIVDDNAIQSENEFTALTKGLADLAEYDTYKNNVLKHDENLIKHENKLNEVSSQLEHNANKLNKIVDVLPTYTEEEINNTIASLTNGGTVIFRSGIYNGIYKLQVPNVDLIGDLAEITGKIVVGSNNKYTKFFSKIEGFNFTGTENHIEILNTQRFSILNNNFKNGDKAIYIKEGGSANHANEVIDIQFNKFEGVNYCLYVDKHTEGSWMNTAEINFSNNPVTKPKITTLHFECGVDGLTVCNNLFYMFPYYDETNRINKKHHIYIKENSCFVNIQNNQFFESGEESIKICSPSSLIVSGNHFAWNCQKGLYNVIQVIKPQTGVCYVNINNNMFSQFSKHCFSAEDMIINLLFNSNVIEYSDTNISYFGDNLLSSFVHYAVELPRTSRRRDFKCEGNMLNASETDNIRLTTTSETETTSNVINSFNSISMLSNRKITVSSGEKTNIIEIVNSKKQSYSFGGLIVISARSSQYGDSVSSTYIYGVNRINGNDMRLIEISKAGALSGAEAIHTSFEFSATQNILECKPIGSTSGNFYINIMAIGDIAFVGE